MYVDNTVRQEQFEVLHIAVAGIVQTLRWQRQPVTAPNDKCVFAVLFNCVSTMQHVVDAMREALSAEFKAAIPTYDDRLRAKWLTENSVQNTLVVSRLMFTADITAAFEDMEEGNEDALKVGTPVKVLLRVVFSF